MTAQRRDVDRKIVPRLHGLLAAAKQGETASTRVGRTATSPATAPLARAVLGKLRREWEEHRSPAFAADFVAAALVLGELDPAREAARFLLASSPSPLGGHVAQRLLGEASSESDVAADPLDEESVRVEIRTLKKGVRRDPRTALLWAELSRRYAALGQKEKAASAMSIALMLAPHNRFLLRSGARLHLHLRQPDKAHSLLATDASTRSDPWLVAAEIATAPLAGRRSRLMKHGRRLLDSGQFHPNALSELASALATEAFAAGSERDARRLFRASLDKPTENAVAQAGWAAGRGARVDVDQQLLDDTEDSYEARAQFSAKADDSDGAISNAWEWLRVEAFAANPAIFGSYEASLARRYDEAIRFAALGLIANPSNFLLRNNLAFALASSDQVDAAIANLDEVVDARLTDEERQILIATRGLVAFRTGNYGEGRALYRKTIEQSKDPAFRAIAALMLLREEIRAATPAGGAARQLAVRLVDAARHIPSAQAERIPMWIVHINAEAGNEIVPNSAKIGEAPRL